jgi:hypothetical protein
MRSEPSREKKLKRSHSEDLGTNSSRDKASTIRSRDKANKIQEWRRLKQASPAT